MKLKTIAAIALAILTISVSVDASAQKRRSGKSTTRTTTRTSTPKKGIQHLPNYEVDPVAVEYLHPDLAFFDCRGPVRTYEIKEYDEDGNFSIQNYGVHHCIGKFSRSGKTLIDITEADLKRDKDGYVISGDGLYDGCREAIRWQNGHPIYYTYDTASSAYHQYLYDDNGHVSKVLSYGGILREGKLGSVCEYEYLEFDDYGNWTKRKVKHTNYETPVEETLTQICTYTYYK